MSKPNFNFVLRGKYVITYSQDLTMIRDYKGKKIPLQGSAIKMY